MKIMRFIKIQDVFILSHDNPYYYEGTKAKGNWFTTYMERNMYGQSL